MRRKVPDQPLVAPVRLYLEDVQALYDEVANACASVSLETPDFKLDGPDDLLKLGHDRVSRLTLQGDNPTVYVALGPRGALVTSLSDSAEAVAIVMKLQQILLQCRRPLRWMFSWWSQALWGAFEIAGIVVLVRGWPEGDRRTLLVAGCLLAVAVVGFVATVVVRNRRGSVVHLRSRRESRSFLKRNSDALITGAVVALAASALTFLLTYYFATPKK
jgi:hypothetical protein